MEKRNKLIMTKFEQYQKYSKSIVDEFIDKCSMKHDYLDYCNALRIDSNTYYTFYTANTKSLLELSFDTNPHTLSKANVYTSKRRKEATKWLITNHLSYEQWLLKNKISL